MKKTLISLIAAVQLINADSFLFNIENDSIKDDDGHLTNSMVFSWMHKSKDTYFDNIGINLHHDIYTPNDIRETDKTKFDSPYAGHMYLNLSLYKILGENYLHGLGLSLGRIGDETYAKELQQGFHDLLAANNPQGWKHQIDNKTTIGVNYDFVQNIPVGSFFDGKVDINNHFHADYGNFTRGASLGTLIRYSDVLRDDFKTMDNKNTSLVRYPQTKGWSISAGLSYEYTDYFYILDKFKREYNINRGKDRFTTALMFDYYMGESVFSAYLKNSDLGSTDDYWSKQWFGLSYSFQF
jgi:hypothetical protein